MPHIPLPDHIFNVRLDFHFYEVRRGRAKLLPECCFQVVSEDDFIIRVMIEGSKLQPLVTISDKGRFARYKVNIHNSEYIPIPNDSRNDRQLGLRRDDLNDKFFRPYTNYRNLIFADPNYSEHDHTFLGFSIEIFWYGRRRAF